MLSEEVRKYAEELPIEEEKKEELGFIGYR